MTNFIGASIGAKIGAIKQHKLFKIIPVLIYTYTLLSLLISRSTFMIGALLLWAIPQTKVQLLIVVWILLVHFVDAYLSKVYSKISVDITNFCSLDKQKFYKVFNFRVHFGVQIGVHTYLIRFFPHRIYLSPFLSP